MTEFEAVVSDHYQRYPLMRPQDFGKLAYQSEFGPEHLVEDAQGAAMFVSREWQAAEDQGSPRNPEPIGNGLCRFHMTHTLFSPENAKALTAQFVRSAREHTGTREGLEIRVQYLFQLPVEGMAAWLAAWREQGFPPVRHSVVYRNAYRPHYRVLCAGYAQNLINQISR